MIRNLGQVAAIYIGSSAPRNTNLIWLDNTVVPFVFRAYDGSAWSEIATHKWVRAYVDGWLVTLPPRQLADDGDYMLINSNNVNYKITVKDFVKSAVGNPLDFKGVIRVSADFPNPSTLESGDMYVIITSPAGGTVTDPYSGKTFEDSEKIVWDEVTQSWESLGKIDITVDLTTSYSETEVTIHSSAGKETTIQGATDQLAGVMLPGQYSWLQALSNGSIVPGDPSPLTPLTPAHKHNYNDIINRLVSRQETGESTIDPMSQKATTDALNLKFDKASVLQVSGAATDKVMSQKAVTDALKTLSDDFNNKLTNYLPLAGGTMKGNIRFPVGNGIACNDVAGTAAYVVLRTLNVNNSTRMYIGTVNFPTYISSTASDLIHDRNGSSYLLWDTYNLPTPASTTDLANYLPLTGGTLTGQVTIKQGVDIKLRLQSTDADNYCIIQVINAQASQLGVLGYAGDKWAIGHGGTYYEIWDKYNLTAPATYTTNEYNHATLKNKNGQYFTYIKAGTNGLLPHSKATLTSGGSGSLGTSDQSFNAAYINHLHTNRIIFGETGPYIIGSTSATQFLNTEGSAQKVATGGLYVGTSYASNALSLVPANGIYSQGNIKTSGWLTFEDNEWTNTGWAYKEAKGSIKVLSVINETENRPTVNGSVFQFNSRQGHWCTQIWCDQTNVAGVIGTLRFRTTKSYASTEWNPWTALVTEFDLNNYLTKTEASTLYYPYSGRGYLSITSSGRPVMRNNQGYAVKDKDGNEREVLWMGPDNSLNLGNTNAFTLNLLNLRCTTLTYNGNEIATEYYVTNQLANYLPLSGGTISSSRSSPLDINSTHASQSSINFSMRDVNKGAVGFHESLGFFLQNASGETLAVKSDGAYYGVNTNSLRKLATSTDLNNYLPLTGGVLTGSSSRVLGIDFSGGSETFIRVLRNGEQRAAIGFKDGLGAYIYNYNSNKYLFIADDGYARVGTYSDGTRLALITDIPTIYERTIGINGTNWAFYAPTKATTAMIYSPTSAGTSGQILQSTGGVPTWVDASSISPSISISNSGTGNAVTSITTDGHTLTVTKGATYLTSHQTIYDLTFQAGTFSAKTFDPNGAAATVNIPTNTSHLTNDSGFITSSALNGYATQSWVNSQNFVKSTSTKKVTDIQPVDALPATQVSGVLYLVFG